MLTCRPTGKKLAHWNKKDKKKAPRGMNNKPKRYRRSKNMPFNSEEVAQLLVNTGRRCCICQLLHMVSVRHIVPSNEGGTNDIDNAIPLCPLCHDCVHSVYAAGRVTRSYTPYELKLHRQRTIDMVRTLPASIFPAIKEATIPNITATHQSSGGLSAAAKSSRNVLRLSLRLRDLLVSAREPFIFEGESETGRRLLQEANLSINCKTETELVWYYR